MRMQTKLSIVTVVGAVALLLTVLAGVIAPRPQTAYAQQNTDPPTVHIQLSTVGTMTQGGQLFVKYTFGNIKSTLLVCDKSIGGPHSTTFDPCYHRSEIYLRDTTSKEPQCMGSGPRSFSKGTGDTKVIGYSNNRISPNCPVGLYTLKVILMGSDRDPNSLWTATANFQVVPPPTSTSTPPGGGNQGGGNQGGGNNQGGNNQGGNNQGGNNQGGNNQGGNNQGRQQPGRQQPDCDPDGDVDQRYAGAATTGRHQPGRQQPDRDPDSHADPRSAGAATTGRQQPGDRDPDGHAYRRGQRRRPRQPGQRWQQWWQQRWQRWRPRQPAEQQPGTQ